MRILAAIPHYFNPQRGAKHGSMRPNSATRVNGLIATLNGLQQFTQPAYVLGLTSEPTKPIYQAHHASVDVIICTVENRHLLAQLPGNAAYIHRQTDAEPQLLGYECRMALRERIGAYDYYCYLEDDLIIRDLSFFAKLEWFASFAGGDTLLQPNRFELALASQIKKLYIDGDLAPGVSGAFQNVNDRPEISAEVLSSRVCFRRPLNPHAGCYFLNSAQFAHWVQQPEFGDRDPRYVGPLESAATQGVMSVFRIYKPAEPNMSFLEIQHYGAEILTAVERASAVHDPR